MMMLIFYTGASYGLTMFRSDFIDNMKCDIPVKDVTKVKRVIGIRNTLYKSTESNGQDIFLPCISYHLTRKHVCLLSPHTYYQMHSGHCVLQGNQVTMQYPCHRIHIPVDIGGTNLLVVHNLFVTLHQKRAIDPQMRSSMAY